MFSVYGKAGRVFRGSLEELQKIGPVSAISRPRAVAPHGQSVAGSARPAFSELLESPDRDLAHRSAVAAYVQTASPENNRHPLSRVSDLMSPEVVTISDEFTVGNAWAVLADRHLGQAPVVDAGGTLVGLLSRGDLMRAERLPGPDTHVLVWKAWLAQIVVDVMTTPLPAVAPDTDIRRVARVMLEAGLPGLPVVDEDGQVRGFVSRSDILRAVIADPPLDLWT
jgi:CBS domain-containing protein